MNNKRAEILQLVQAKDRKFWDRFPLADRGEAGSEANKEEELFLIKLDLDFADDVISLFQGVNVDDIVNHESIIDIGSSVNKL